jgi:hypothetical protein
VKTLEWIPVVVTVGVLLAGPMWERGLPGFAMLKAQDPLYKPPLRGAPARRVGAGTRGSGDDLPSVFALAPNHVGLTTRAQPELYWYLSKDSRHPVTITISDEVSVEPLLETVLPPPIQAGIHRIQLATYEIRLQPDVPYEWFIALATSADDPSQELVTGSAIQYIGPDDARAQNLMRSLKTALNQAEAWRLYAASGIWYDAVAALAERIRQAPQATDLLKQRAALLKEADLSEIPTDAKQHP